MNTCPLPEGNALGLWSFDYEPFYLVRETTYTINISAGKTEQIEHVKFRETKMKFYTCCENSTPKMADFPHKSVVEHYWSGFVRNILTELSCAASKSTRDFARDAKHPAYCDQPLTAEP